MAVTIHSSEKLLSFNLKDEMELTRAIAKNRKLLSEIRDRYENDSTCQVVVVYTLLEQNGYYYFDIELKSANKKIKQELDELYYRLYQPVLLHPFCP